METALCCDQGRARRLLIIPALFDESNRLRRFTAEVMRALDQQDIDSFLPDLPGTNESVAPLVDQTLTSWSEAVASSAMHFATGKILTIRAGAAIPAALNGWAYAPLSGAAALRHLLRARSLARREKGVADSHDAALEQAGQAGITLAGHPIGAQLFRELAQHDSIPAKGLRIIPQGEIGGAGLWLRAEPGEDADQAAALAALIAREWPQ